MHTVAIIPARGGSKGLQNKNIYPVAGRPLLAWTILQALASTSIERVFVTTDDQAIASVAKEYGAEVIVRPAELSGDKATSESAILHAAGVIEQELSLPAAIWIDHTRCCLHGSVIVPIYFSKMVEVLEHVCCTVQIS